MTRIARVFPRRTRATPDDELAFVDCQPPMLALPEIDEVHVSVAFTWDLPRAEQLAEMWRATGAPVTLGGPAFNRPGEAFVPGRYVRQGYTITSRGCPNHCWFCAVPQREGGLRELPIREGYNVLDDNLLACSAGHVEAVFEMLARQPQRAEITGGLEARLLKPWHAARLREIRARRLVEMCYRTHKTLVNPIVDWSDDDVWEFHRAYRIPYCGLYDEGYHRLGCIGCPLPGSVGMRMEFARWPKYRAMYVGDADRLICDLEHSLENDSLAYHDYARLGKEIRAARRDRRTAKNAAQRLDPFVDWFERNRNAVNELERTLGAMRQIEEKQRNWVYVPRTGKEKP